MCHKPHLTLVELPYLVATGGPPTYDIQRTGFPLRPSVLRSVAGGPGGLFILIQTDGSHYSDQSAFRPSHPLTRDSKNERIASQHRANRFFSKKYLELEGHVPTILRR